MKLASISLVFLTVSALSASVDSARFIRQEGDKKIFSLHDYVTACLKAGEKEISLPSGRYHADRGVSVVGGKNFTIAGSGTEKTVIVFQHLKPILEGKETKSSAPAHGFFLDKCSDFRLRDFSVDFDPLPFVQGTITEVRKGGKEFVLKLHKGYPRAHEFYTRGNVSGVLIFDGKSRRFKPGVYENYYRQTILDKDTYLCTNAAFAEWNIDRIRPGDLAAFGFRSICAFRMERCSRFLLENLTVYSAPGMGYYSMYSRDHRYRNIRIVRGKKPDGATEERLLSAVADAFTHRYALNGPILENSEFSFMGDDSVNISSHIHPVVKIEGRTVTIAARYPDCRLELLSDVLNTRSTAVFAAFGDWGITASPRLLAVSPLRGKEPPISEDFRKRWKLRTGGQAFYLLTLGEDLPSAVKVGDGVYFPDMNGRGYVIRNNYFHDHRAVGLRLMGEDGLVENNRFEHIAFGAVELACSMGIWRESGWSKNITIRDNTIRSVNEHPVQNDHMGAIASRVEYRGYRPGKFPHCHENIVISGNRIENTFADGISLVGAKNVRIENNTIENYDLAPTEARGYADDLVAGYGLCVQQSGEVRLAGNRISPPGRFSRGKSAVNPPGRKELAAADARALWGIPDGKPHKNLLCPQYDPKGGVILRLGDEVILNDANGIGVLKTVPAERGIAGWGYLDWQRRTPAPRKTVSENGKAVTFSTTDESMTIRKVCTMVSPGEFQLAVSGECKTGDTISWTAVLPERVYSNAVIVESDGSGYPLPKISPLSPDCFKGRKYTRDVLRHHLGRLTVQLPGGQRIRFELEAGIPAGETPRDLHWFLMGGRDPRTGQSSDFILRNRLRYTNGKNAGGKFDLKLKVAVLPSGKEENQRAEIRNP
ncbi:MAG: right-handed parallel beta-helix repeat-containing protein [Lentisphaeria bacterium]|nr:right-handed parallel beta-helix repeat-containing protein [Lentisphaeria bacterium]